MLQQIHQAIALVAYGNLYLQNRSEEFNLDRLITDNCYRLDFVDPPIEGIAGSSKVLASDAFQWFEYLKHQGAKGLKLHYESSSRTDFPDHITSAFVGGGSRWFVEVQFENTSDLYLSEWSPSEDYGLDKRKNHYLRFERDLNHLDTHSTTIREPREKLTAVLQELIEFTERFDDTQHWSENFKNYLAILQEYEPLEADEFLPAGIYNKESRQLIEAANASWVFGGMGSFNDLSFNDPDQELYLSLSDKLYRSICDAIVSAVNSQTITL